MKLRYRLAVKRQIIAISTCMICALTVVTATAATPPRFADETGSAGIDHSYNGGWEHLVGGGVAAFDCSGDAFPELYFAGGNNPAALYGNLSEPGGPLAFEHLSRPELELTAVTGAYPLDIDADGLVDLAILRVGENLLMRGLGDCRFERANERWNFDGGSEWSTAFSATWHPGESWPTLAVGNYVDRTQPGSPWGTCHANLLYRPASTEEQGFIPALTLTPSYCTLSLLFSDWNRSGTAALRVSNDRQYYLTNRDRSGTEQLWHFDGEGLPVLYQESDGWQQLQIWGMGIASADITGDGYPEYLLTSMTDNKLRTLAAGTTQPSYRDIAFQRGVTAHRPFTGGDTNPSTGWHAAFEDVNNDGFADLFIAKGNVDAMPNFALKDPNNLLLGEPDGRFTESAEAAGLLSFKRARGAAVVDLNADGLLDVVVVNRGDGAELWRNLGQGTAARPELIGNWLALRLEQPGGNRDAVGAWIEVRTEYTATLRELTVGGGHAGGAHGFWHFGLGEAQEAEVRVRWPDGHQGPWLPLQANQLVIIERDKQAGRPALGDDSF